MDGVYSSFFLLYNAKYGVSNVTIMLRKGALRSVSKPVFLRLSL